MPANEEERQDMRQRIEESRRGRPRVTPPASVRALRPSVYETDRPKRRDDAVAAEARAKRSLLRLLAGNGPMTGEALVKRAQRTEGPHLEHVQSALRALVKEGLIETAEGVGSREVVTVRWRLTTKGQHLARTVTR